MADNIFTELYNKILSLFGQATVEKEESKNTAVNRLRLVLMQDRTNLTPEIMHKMRSELINVLSKYVELDKEALELNFEQEGEQMALMLSIPVIRAKDEAEIEKALKEGKEEKKAENSEDNIEPNQNKDDDEANELDEADNNDADTEISESEKEESDDNDSDSEIEKENIKEEILEKNEEPKEEKEVKTKKASKNDDEQQ